MKAGENIIVSFNLQNAETGELISSRRVVCQGEAGITDGIDELGREIKSDLNLQLKQIAQDMDMDLSSITSRSPAALRYYIEGYRLRLRGDRDLTKSFFEKAISIDSEFAMAYRALALSLDSREDQVKNYKKALELSNRLSRRERHIIEATYYYIAEENYEKAKQQLLLGLQEVRELGSKASYQGRFILHNRLAHIYLIEGNLAAALDEAEKALEVSGEPEAAASGSVYPLHALTAKAEIFLEIGQFDQAQEAAEEIRQLIKKNYAGQESVLQRRMKDYYFVAGKIELKKGNLKKAINDLEKAQSLEPNPLSINPSLIADLASAYHQAGKLESARKEYEKIPLLTQGRLSWVRRSWKR